MLRYTWNDENKVNCSLKIPAQWRADCTSLGIYHTVKIPYRSRMCTATV